MSGGRQSAQNLQPLKTFKGRCFATVHQIVLLCTPSQPVGEEQGMVVLFFVISCFFWELGARSIFFSIVSFEGFYKCVWPSHDDWKKKDNCKTIRMRNMKSLRMRKDNRFGMKIMKLGNYWGRDVTEAHRNISLFF